MNEPDQHQPTNTPKREDLPRLYSLNGIGFATFFGSMLAGFFLLAANYHALGLKRPAAVTLGAGITVFCAYFVIVMTTMGPPSMGPAVGQTNALQFNMTQAILSNVGRLCSAVGHPPVTGRHVENVSRRTWATTTRRSQHFCGLFSLPGLSQHMPNLAQHFGFNAGSGPGRAFNLGGKTAVLPSSYSFLRQIDANSSVEFTFGNSVSGKGFCKNRHSGSHPSPGRNTNNCSAGTVSITS